MTLHRVLKTLSPKIGSNLTINRIPTALTNACYKIESDGATFALRLNYSRSKDLGIDRKREADLLQLIKGKDYGLPVIDLTSNWLLSSWLTADKGAVTINEYIQLFIAVHNTSVDNLRAIPPLLVDEQIERLLKHQQNALSESSIQRIRDEVAEYEAPKKLSLCFHDWHSGNIIRANQTLRLLDWEYAAPGDVAVDLACFISGMAFDQTTEAELLAQLGIDNARYETAKRLTQYMSTLWYGARFQDENIENKLQVLCEQTRRQ